MGALFALGERVVWSGIGYWSGAHATAVAATAATAGGKVAVTKGATVVGGKVLAGKTAAVGGKTALLGGKSAAASVKAGATAKTHALHTGGQHVASQLSNAGANVNAPYSHLDPNGLNS